MSSAPAAAHAASSPGHAASHGHGHHHEPGFFNKLILGPYRFEWMALSLPFRLAWALLGVVGGAIRHPIKTVKSVIAAVPMLLGAWIAMYIVVAIVSTWRGDKNVLGRIDTPFIYAWHGVRYLLADSWRTADTFVGILAYDMGAVTGLHGILLLLFAMAFPHATILAGIVAACQTIAWWCDYGGVAHAIGAVFGAIAGLAMMLKFVPGMSLGGVGGAPKHH